MLGIKEKNETMWNPEEQINKVMPAFSRMQLRLTKAGIDSARAHGGNINNVLFTKGDKQVFISCHSVFRFSGISSITRDKVGVNNQSEAVPVTDDDYMTKFMEPIIKTLLEKA